MSLDGDGGILSLMISKKALSQSKKIFQSYPLEAAYLFGSQIKGKTGALSDIDIAVLFTQKGFTSLSLELVMKLIGDLKETFKKENVDLVILNNASPVLKHQVVLCGQRIYSRDEKRALEFEKKVLQEYEDTAFLRKVYYHYMRERIRNNQLGEFPK